MVTAPSCCLRSLHVAAAVLALAAAVGCQGGGIPSIFGYQIGSEALYDPNIKTVYIPVSSNRAFQTTPNRGIEVDITRAVIREIGAKTPFRVVSDPAEADTELLMNVVDVSKQILNRNQQNLTREAELDLTVDVLWRDLRTGKNLSAPLKGRALGTPGQPTPGQQPPPFDPSVEQPPPVTPPQSALPVRLVATGRLLPELGESYATAQKMAIDSLATQIVSLMEKPWGKSAGNGR